DDIVAGERLAMQVRVHQPKAAKPPLCGAKPADIRKNQLGRIADDDVVDLTGSVHERTDLPAGLLRSLRQPADELRGRDLLERNAARMDSFESLGGAGGQAGRVSVELGHSGGRAGPAERGRSGFPYLCRGPECYKRDRLMATFTPLELDEARRLGEAYGLSVA